ncbi:hypothetical protein [Clostridium baratii]|nr:hypothetical protein [Clostridium baratii]MDU1052978.1 hypothetical protein [Clostridium baratii]
MTLLEECLEVLKDNYTIVSDDEKSRILNKLENKFQFIELRRID